MGTHGGINMLLSYDADILPKVRMMGQIRYSTPWVHFPRTINEYILYAITEGNMYLREDNKEYALKAGDVFILEPGLLHEGYQKATCSYYYAHFTHPSILPVEDAVSALEAFNENRRQSLISYSLEAQDPTSSTTYLPKLFHLRSSQIRTRLSSAVNYYNSREENYKRKTATELHLFLLDMAHEYLLAQNNLSKSKINKSEAIVEKILSYLNANYSQRITSADIAEQFEVNFDYINRVFAAKTGSPIFTYINILRISNAKQLIATTELPFTEIAYLVGIDDRYYFSKLFKKITGQTPSDYYKESRYRI